MHTLQHVEPMLQEEGWQTIEQSRLGVIADGKRSSGIVMNQLELASDAAKTSNGFVQMDGDVMHSNEGIRAPSFSSDKIESLVHLIMISHTNLARNCDCNREARRAVSQSAHSPNRRRCTLWFLMPF